MATPESRFTQYFMRKLPTTIYKWKIMNGMQNGVPDCYFSGTKDDLWVEVKWIGRVPKREDTEIDPGLSELQARWLLGRWQEGRNVAVVVGSTDGCCILREAAMFNTIYKGHLSLPRTEITPWIITQTQG